MSTAQMENVIRQVRNMVLGSAGGMTDAQLLDSFLTNKDEAAFEALIRRHGTMVLSVCRRVLKNPHDAEDAFQATFLVLIRKAASIGRRNLLANWLYGVAQRTALKARSVMSRRRARETQMDDLPQKDAPELSDGLLSRLDHELSRLPDKYRAPVVLCDLEDMSRSDAASKLGWPVGTVNWRLAKARTMLANRLTRQGISLSAGGIAVALSCKSASASVSPALITETVKAGTAMANGVAVSSALFCSTPFVLAGVVVKTMFLEKLRLGTIMLVALIMLGAVAGGFATRSMLAASEAKEQPEANQPAEQRHQDVPPPISEIKNFRVEGATPEIARKIGLAAERYRKEKALEWLGHELPQWPERCPIRVKLTDSGSGGATTFAFDNGNVTQQSMHIEGSLESILKIELPHEMTHVILAHHFGTPIPRWADEGAAILSSDEGERRRYEKKLRSILKEPGRMIPLRRLFPRTDYPRDVMALYAEGCSVTRFLVEAKGRKTFLKFIGSGQKDGWDDAVKRYYGYSGVDGLEEAWLRSVANKTKRAGDDELLQGRWISTAWEEAGMAELPEHFADYRVEFRDHAMTMQHRTAVASCPFQLDPTANPKRIELRSFGITTHGIYRLEGDRLTLCLAEKGRTRPSQFSTNMEDGGTLLYLKRVEDAAQKDKEPEFERKLELAFGKDSAAIKKSSIKLDLPSRHLALAANTFDILDDGRVKLSGCWYASFDTHKITTIRCNEAVISVDGSITDLADLSRHKILAIEPSGSVRITFLPLVENDRPRSPVPQFPPADRRGSERQAP